MPESNTLQHWTILSLRPQNQHAAVRQVATRLGARTISFSAFKLAPLSNQAALSKALNCSIRIASSPAAVRHAAVFGPLQDDWLAIGHSTAQQLFRAGARSVQIPEPQNADGLLALDSLSGIKNTRIGLLTAPDGRGELEQTLIARGAELHIAHVYQRLPVTLNKQQLAQFDALNSRTALLISSQKAFAHIWSQMNTARREKIKTLICVTSSVRLLEYLHALGLTRVFCSYSTLPHKQLSALAEAVANKA
jgi:uroporphyrinogen-III synthase